MAIIAAWDKDPNSIVAKMLKALSTLGRESIDRLALETGRGYNDRVKSQSKFSAQWFKESPPELLSKGDLLRPWS